MPQEVTIEDRRLPVASWLPAREWADASPSIRRKLLDEACAITRREKLLQLRNSVGADGARLAKRKHPRADRASGPVLTPHRSASRAEKWVRCVPAYKAGTITVTWSHGWLTILGYHAEGKVRGAPVRNVLEFPLAAIRRIRDAVVRAWRALMRTAERRAAAARKGHETRRMPKWRLAAGASVRFQAGA